MFTSKYWVRDEWIGEQPFILDWDTQKFIGYNGFRASNSEYPAVDEDGGSGAGIYGQFYGTFPAYRLPTTADVIYDIDVKVTTWVKTGGVWSVSPFHDNAFITTGGGGKTSIWTTPLTAPLPSGSTPTNPSGHPHAGWWDASDATLRIRGITASRWAGMFNSSSPTTGNFAFWADPRATGSEVTDDHPHYYLLFTIRQRKVNGTQERVWNHGLTIYNNVWPNDRPTVNPTLVNDVTYYEPGPTPFQLYAEEHADLVMDAEYVPGFKMVKITDLTSTTNAERASDWTRDNTYLGSFGKSFMTFPTDPKYSYDVSVTVTQTSGPFKNPAKVLLNVPAKISGTALNTLFANGYTFEEWGNHPNIVGKFYSPSYHYEMTAPSSVYQAVYNDSRAPAVDGSGDPILRSTATFQSVGKDSMAEIFAANLNPNDFRVYRDVGSIGSNLDTPTYDEAPNIVPQIAWFNNTYDVTFKVTQWTDSVINEGTVSFVYHVKPIQSLQAYVDANATVAQNQIFLYSTIGSPQSDGTYQNVNTDFSGFVTLPDNPGVKYQIIASSYAWNTLTLNRSDNVPDNAQWIIGPQDGVTRDQGTIHSTYNGVGFNPDDRFTAAEANEVLASLSWAESGYVMQNSSIAHGSYSVSIAIIAWKDDRAFDSAVRYVNMLGPTGAPNEMSHPPFPLSTAGYGEDAEYYTRKGTFAQGYPPSPEG